MADFSIGEAAFAGFRVVGRRPAVVFGWGLMIFVCIFLPIMLVLGSLVPLVAEIGRMAAEQGAHPDRAMGGKSSAGAGPPPEFWAIYLRMMMLQPMLFIGALVLRAVLSSAVIRAVLTPEDDRWFYLRIGMRELWVLLVSFVIQLIVGFGAMFALLPVMFGIGISVYMHQYIAAGVVGGVALLAFITVAIIISLRLYMGVAMSWDHNEFRLFESWGFTRGHVGKMFGLALIQIVMVLVFEAVIGGITVAVVYGLTRSSQFDQAHVQAWLAQPHPNLGAPVLAIVVVGALVFSLIGAFFMAVLSAPWADVYRQLRDSSPAAPAYAHAPGEAPIAPPPAPAV